MSRPSSRPSARTISAPARPPALSVPSNNDKEQVDEKRRGWLKSGEDIQSLKNAIAQTQKTIEEESCAFLLHQQTRSFLIQQNEQAKSEKRQLEIELRQLLSEKEEARTRGDVELQALKTKLTALLSDQASELQEAQVNELRDRLRAKSTFLQGEERQCRREESALWVYLRELEINHAGLLNDMKLHQQRELMELRLHYERQQAYLRTHYAKLVKSKRNQLETEKKSEINVLENRKTQFINTTLFENKKAMDELKEYFSDIIHSHLEAIKNLKEEVGDMKKKEASLSKQIAHIKKLNENLNVPLFQKQSLLVELKAQHQVHLNDKRDIQSLHLDLKQTNSTIEQLRWDKELMLQKLELVRKELSTKKNKQVNERLEFMQHHSFTELIQKQEMKVYKQEAEKLEAAISELLIASEIDPASVGRIQGGIESLLKEKNAIILKLEDEIIAWKERMARAAKGWRTQMDALAIPEAELGFTIPSC